MFRSGAMRESEDGVVRIPDHSADMVNKMLEFIYTSHVTDLPKLNSNVRVVLSSSVRAFGPYLTGFWSCVAIDRSADAGRAVSAADAQEHV